MKPARRTTLLALVAALVLLTWQAWQAQQHGSTPGDGRQQPAGAAVVQDAFVTGQSGVWMQVAGRVTRILSDDNGGSRHQRFVLEVGGGHTVLVAHNVDLARRLPLATGDDLVLRGRYEWNERGGVIHWTHHDPAGVEDGGWIERQGVRYR
jgi:hypothetical protein